MMLFHCFSVCREPDFPGSDGGADRKESSADSAGKQWKTDACFKMLGRTLLHNNSRECYLSACAKEGSDIVTISISGDPCDICARYENRLLSISGKTKGLVTLEQAMSEGLFHPNCTHRMIAVPEVVAQEYYGKDGKEKAEKDVAWEKHLAHQELRKEQLDRAQQNRIERRNAEEDDRKKAAHEAHLKHRQEQLSQAKKNRTKREAELIGADLIKGEHTRQDDLKATNPNYNKSKEWNVNCQRVVYAYEARRRGYDVVALPKILEDQGYDPMNDHFEEVCHNMQWNSPNNPTAQGALDAINKAMAKFGNDSRAVVYVEWERDNPAEKRQAHVFIAENIEGKIKYVDPQNDDDNVDAYFWGAIPENTSFARLDNLKFSNYIKLCCERRKP